MKMDLGLCLGGDSPVVGGASVFDPTAWLTYNDAGVSASIGESVDSTITDWVDTRFGAATYENLANAPTLREYNSVKYVEFSGADQMVLSGPALDIKAVTIVGLARARVANDGYIMGKIGSNVQVRIYNGSLEVVGSPTLWGNTLSVSTNATDWNVFTAILQTTSGSSIQSNDDTADTTTSTQASAVLVDMLGAINGNPGQVDIQGFVSAPTVSVGSTEINIAKAFFAAKRDLLNA